MQLSNQLAHFWEGFLGTAPLWLYVAPFGLAYALAAQPAGLGAAETIGMSVLVTAGASQLTAVALLGSGADAISIVLGTLIVNLRHIPLAISLAPLLASLSRTRKAMLAFFLTDPSYGMSVQRLQGRERGAVAYFLGSGASLYVSWVVSTIAGLLIGGAIPDPASLGLHLVFPLSLMALLVPMVQSRAAVAVILVAGVLALGARMLLPGTSYIPVAAVGGTVAGALLEARR